MRGDTPAIITRPFWSIRLAPVLWVAVLGTQIQTTFIAIYGLFMAPFGWGYALV